VIVATHDVEFAASFARRVVLLAEGRVIADDDAEHVLSGGWYFATEVARVLGAAGTITAERGAELLRREAVEP
jgi:energy-coupling factor transport system ATP-binding protein